MLFERTILREDLIRCALCEDAPCTAACGQLPVAKILRSVWFDDEKVAAARLPERLPCVSCSAHCESACVRPREVPIWKLKREAGLICPLTGEPDENDVFFIKESQESLKIYHVLPAKSLRL